MLRRSLRKSGYDAVDGEFHPVIVDHVLGRRSLKLIAQGEIKGGRQCLSLDVITEFRKRIRKRGWDRGGDINPICHAEARLLPCGLNKANEISCPTLGLQFGIDFRIQHHDPSPGVEWFGHQAFRCLQAPPESMRFKRYAGARPSPDL